VTISPAVGTLSRLHAIQFSWSVRSTKFNTRFLSSDLIPNLISSSAGTCHIPKLSHLLASGRGTNPSTCRRIYLRQTKAITGGMWNSATMLATVFRRDGRPTPTHTAILRSLRRSGPQKIVRMYVIFPLPTNFANLPAHDVHQLALSYVSPTSSRTTENFCSTLTIT
jgi:hypothetical protein